MTHCDARSAANRDAPGGCIGQHRGVIRLLWDDVKQWFDPSENGGAPDVVVVDTDLVDWGRLLELIRSRGWRCEYRLRDEVLALPRSAAELFSPDAADWATSLWVWPDPHLEWIVRPWSAEEILSHVSLYQSKGRNDSTSSVGSWRRLVGPSARGLSCTARAPSMAGTRR